MNKKNTLGLTLMELLIVIAITGILAGVAVPMYSDMITKNRLASESEKVLRYLTYARSESVKNNKNITLSFNTGASWCLGLSDANPGACDCTTANSCKIGSVEKVIKKANSANFSLAVDATLQNANFDPLRGMLEKSNAPTTGTVTLSGSSLSTSVLLNILGRADICSSSLTSYSDCPVVN